MTRNQKGSATLHSLFAAVLLLTALAGATLWSTISTARHKLATAADLTALSAAQSLTATDPCVTAARIAGLHKVKLIGCHPTPTSVTVQVGVQLHLPFADPSLAATSRAGPL